MTSSSAATCTSSEQALQRQLEEVSIQLAKREQECDQLLTLLWIVINRNENRRVYISLEELRQAQRVNRRLFTVQKPMQLRISAVEEGCAPRE